MKYSNNGLDWNVVNGGTSIVDSLPPDVYELKFHKMRGLWLSTRKPLAEVGFKVYGATPQRVQKVLGKFERRSGNLGVLLSGEKGMGKSVFMRSLSKEAVKRGYPVIVVPAPYPGLVEYLQSIEDECIVLIDEFEKLFPSGGDVGECPSEVSDNDCQSGLLSMFDGLDSGKKMFVAAVNNIYRMSRFFLNRPGRFYYHFRFSKLTPDDVRAYLNDRIEGDKTAVDRIAPLANFNAISYDMLSAIAAELNDGYSVEETLNDLNIGVREGNERIYVDVSTTVNGKKYACNNVALDIGDPSDGFCLYNCNDVNDRIGVRIRTDKIRFDETADCMVVNEDGIFNAECPDGGRPTRLEIVPSQYGNRYASMFDMAGLL